MIRVFVSVLPLLCLSACGSSATHGSTRIVVDRSIGAVSLFEKRIDVERVLGKGVVVQKNDREHFATVKYRAYALEVGYSSRTKEDSAHEQAIFILTTSPRYQTPSGVGVGSTRADVASISGVTCYVSTDCQHGSTHNKPGTGFALRGGRVWRIVVTILD